MKNKPDSHISILNKEIKMLLKICNKMGSNNSLLKSKKDRLIIIKILLMKKIISKFKKMKDRDNINIIKIE